MMSILRFDYAKTSDTSGSYHVPAGAHRIATGAHDNADGSWRSSPWTRSLRKRTRRRQEISGSGRHTAAAAEAEPAARVQRVEASDSDPKVRKFARV